MESVEGRYTHVVWKFDLSPLVIFGAMTVPWRRGSKILKVAGQHGHYHAWVEVDLRQGVVERNFIMVGTGHKFEKDSSDAMITMEYVDTIFLQDGQFVFHIYELVVG